MVAKTTGVSGNETPYLEIPDHTQVKRAGGRILRRLGCGGLILTATSQLMQQARFVNFLKPPANSAAFPMFVSSKIALGSPRDLLMNGEFVTKRPLDVAITKGSPVVTPRGY